MYEKIYIKEKQPENVVLSKKPYTRRIRNLNASTLLIRHVTELKSSCTAAAAPLVAVAI